MSEWKKTEFCVLCPPQLSGQHRLARSRVSLCKVQGANCIRTGTRFPSLLETNQHRALANKQRHYWPLFIVCDFPHLSEKNDD